MYDFKVVAQVVRHQDRDMVVLISKPKIVEIRDKGHISLNFWLD
jgi:hypothetical protein